MRTPERRRAVFTAYFFAAFLAALAAPHVAEAQTGTCSGPDLVAPSTSIPGTYPYQPALAYGNGEFALVAMEQPQYPAQYPANLVFQRLTAAGALLGGPVLFNSGVNYVPSGPSLVWNGSGYALTWFAGGKLVFVRLTPDGQQIGSRLEIPGADSGYPAWPAGLVWTGSEYGLLWGDTRIPGLVFARISAAGAMIGAPILVRQRGGGFARLAVGSNGFGVTWAEQDAEFNDRAHFRALAADGTPVGTDSLFLDPESVGHRPEIVGVGDRYAVVWARNQGVRLAFLDPNGLVEGSVIPVSALGTWKEAIVSWTGSELMIIWTNDAGDGDLHARHTDGAGTLLGEDRRMTWEGRYPDAGVLAWTGEHFGLSWTPGQITTPHGSLFSVLGCDCRDADRDQWTTCRGDCNDEVYGVHPGAPEICDLEDDDCDGIVNEDVDYLISCGLGPCVRTIHYCPAGVPLVCIPGPPGPETCNGIDDDCDGVLDNGDQDGDGSYDCVDCNPANPAVHPGATELCNGIDDDCDGIVDDSGGALDGDGDGVIGACDNCPAVANPSQEDPDHDGVGSACDNCPTAFNPSQVDTDHDGTADACDLCPLDPWATTDPDRDGLGTACDNCPGVANPGQEDSDFDAYGDACDHCPGRANTFNDDTDADTLGDACDNCPFNTNLDQSDSNGDGEGDACDLNDGLVMIWVTGPEEVDWDSEPGFTWYDVYRGDLDRLKATGESTQDPASVPLAGRFCGQMDAFLLDDPPPAGKGVFYLVAVTTSSGDLGIGDDSAGHPRLNAHPCP
jgi:hypothetical protein